MFREFACDGALHAFFCFSLYNVDDPPAGEEVVDVPVDFFVVSQVALNTFFETAESRADVCVVAGL